MSEGLPAPRRVDIAAMRDRFELSRLEFADRLHVAPRTIRRWETGAASPSPMAMANIRRLQRQLTAEREQRGQGGEGGSVGDRQSGTSAGLGNGPQASAPARAAEATLPKRRLPSL